jgi:hypothetical protein
MTEPAENIIIKAIFAEHLEEHEQFVKKRTKRTSQEAIEKNKELYDDIWFLINRHRDILFTVPAFKMWIESEAWERDVVWDEQAGEYR